MKTKSILFVLSIIIFVTSCWQDNWYHTYLFINDSKHDVAVAIYNNPAPYTMIDTVFIKNGESHLWRQQLGEVNHGWEIYTADSIRLLFDNDKYLTYYNWNYTSDSIYNLVRNPVNTIFHEENCTRKYGCDFTYSITEEDYENAVPLVASH